jgi:hypothetical protein
MKTYIIDLTDEDGRRRTVTIESRHELDRLPHGFTLAAHAVRNQRKINVAKVHDITEVQ